MERAGQTLGKAAAALDAQINKHKAQEETAEVKHVMNFVMAIARAAPLAPQAETDRLASASENFSSVLERVAFVAGDLKKVFASVQLYAPLFSATLRLLSAAVPLATAPGSHVDRAAIAAIQAQLITDPRTLYWWSQFIATQVAGPLALHVNWETFALAFHRSLDPPQPLSTTDSAILKFVLDPFESGSIASWRYGDLARALGPPSAIITRLRELTSLRAFIGYASSTEADRLLAFEPAATLLVRISRGRPSQWALASKDAWNHKVAHTVITLHPGELRVAEKSYNNFVALITDLHLGQGHPALPREPSFYGELLAARADDMLTGKPQGTYLWRFSSRTPMLALSFVAKEGAPAQHITVEQTAATTFKIEEHTHAYSTLAEIISALAPSHKLSVPLVRTLWFGLSELPVAEAAALSVSRSKTEPTSPGRRGVMLGGSRQTGSSTELVPPAPDVRTRGPSPSGFAPSPLAQRAEKEKQDGAGEKRASERHNAATQTQTGGAPLLASRPQLHREDKEGYDFMPLGGIAASKAAPTIAESAVFEPLLLSEKPVPAFAIHEPEQPSPKGNTVESPHARPSRQGERRKQGDYAFMPSRSDSNPAPLQSSQPMGQGAGAQSLANPNNPLNNNPNPLRSPGRKPVQTDGEYDFMPNP